MAQSEVQDFLKATLPKLEKGGRTAEAASLRRWVTSAPVAGHPGS